MKKNPGPSAGVLLHLTTKPCHDILPCMENKTRALEMIAEYRNLVQDALEHERAAVHHARECGASWAEIGRLYEVTRQAAWQRWKNVERSVR